MVDITHKQNTLRTAIAEALIKVSSPETISAIENKIVPKGDVFEMSRAAGLLGIKRTPELLPDCHPLPVEYAGITYEIEGLTVKISVTVKTIYKTGVEVEAMTGAAIVALNIYDMLKPIDKGVEIGHIRLLKKTGGKSSIKQSNKGLKAIIIVCSDSISKGIGTDKSGLGIRERLENFHVTTNEIIIIPDDPEKIIQSLEENTSGDQADLVIFTGGTGVGPRDQTPESITPLLDMELKGVSEQIRRYGQERTPFAMLSRSVAGVINGKIVLALPGSVNGAKEGIDACFPHILHVFDIINGQRH